MSKNNNNTNLASNRTDSLVDNDALRITEEGLEGLYVYNILGNHVYIEDRKEALKTKIIELLGGNVQKAQMLYDELSSYTQTAEYLDRSAKNLMAEVLEGVKAHESNHMKFAGFRAPYVLEVLSSSSSSSSASSYNNDVDVTGNDQDIDHQE